MQKIEKGDLVQCNAIKCRPCGTVERIEEDGTVVARVTQQDRAKCRYEFLSYFPECFTLVTKGSAITAPREFSLYMYSRMGVAPGKLRMTVEGDDIRDTELNASNFKVVALRSGEIVVDQKALATYIQKRSEAVFWKLHLSGDPLGYAYGSNMITGFLNGMEP